MTQITDGLILTKMENTLVIVGSYAHNVSGRAVKDIDFIGSFSAINTAFKKLANVFGKETQYAESDSNIVLKTTSGHIFEGSIAWEGSSNADILKWVDGVSALGCKGFLQSAQLLDVALDFYYAPDVLCWMLKESHKYKDSVHFEKTRLDVLEYRKLKGTIHFDHKELNEILAKREEETYRPAIKLNVEKDNFFANDGIDYSICPHDTIHDFIALGYNPAYKKIQVPGSDVMCDKRLWVSSTLETKMHCVIEEARVIAIERGILPFGKTYVSDDEALKLFKTALQKICTTLCSGWFREFAWINYDKIIQQHMEYEKVQNTNFIDIFHIDWKSK